MYFCLCDLVFPPFLICCSSAFPMFGNPTYEVSARYIKQSSNLDKKCQPNGGDEEFRRGNLTGISNVEIKSGLHGNIQLLPPGVGPCMYRVTVSYLLSGHSTAPWLTPHSQFAIILCFLQLAALWIGPNVTIPFLQNFRQEYPRIVDIICKEAFMLHFSPESSCIRV